MEPLSEGLGCWATVWRLSKTGIRQPESPCLQFSERASVKIVRLSLQLRRITLRAAPTESDLATSEVEALHALDGALRVCFAHELDKAAVFANWYLDLRKIWVILSSKDVEITHVVDLAEGAEERTERLLGDQRTETANEDRRIVGVMAEAVFVVEQMLRALLRSKGTGR